MINYLKMLKEKNQVADIIMSLDLKKERSMNEEIKLALAWKRFNELKGLH